MEIEAELQLVPQMKEAEMKYRKVVKRKVIKTLYSQIQKRRNQEKICDQFRNDVIKQNCLLQWAKIIPELRKENVQIEEKNEKIIKQFYNVRSL